MSELEWYVFFLGGVLSAAAVITAIGWSIAQLLIKKDVIHMYPLTRTEYIAGVITVFAFQLLNLFVIGWSGLDVTLLLLVLGFSAVLGSAKERQDE